jgi:plastocyanin
MNNKMLWVVGAVVVVLIAGVVLYTKSNNSQTSTTMDNTSTAPVTNQTADQTQPMASDSAMESSDSAITEGGVKELTVTGSSFKFEPATLTVNKGDKVRVTFKNTGGTHDFVIDEFNVKSKTIPGGQQDVVEFTADKAGTFQYYCGIGNHRAMGMVGTLTVK